MSKKKEEGELAHKFCGGGLLFRGRF